MFSLLRIVLTLTTKNCEIVSTLLATRLVNCNFRVSVRLGECNIETSPDCFYKGQEKKCAPVELSVPIEDAIQHEAYDPDVLGKFDDIALLRLDRNITYSGNR